MSIQEYQQSAKDRITSWNLRKKFLWLLAIVILGYAIYAAFYVFYPYSEGTRTGVLRKLSNKGYVFKTWEGELQMPMTMPTDGTQMTIGGNTWSFSIARGQDVLIRELQEAEQSGTRVTLHYTQYLKQFDWRGETVYFVSKVTKAPQ